MTVVERFKQESMYGLSAKNSGRCGEVAVSGDSTVRRHFKFASNRSKNNRVGKSVVTRVHGSCSLRVIGSWLNNKVSKDSPIYLPKWKRIVRSMRPSTRRPFPADRSISRRSTTDGYLLRPRAPGFPSSGHMRRS